MGMLLVNEHTAIVWRRADTHLSFLSICLFAAKMIDLKLGRPVLDH